MAILKVLEPCNSKYVLVKVVNLIVMMIMLIRFYSVSGMKKRLWAVYPTPVINRTEKTLIPHQYYLTLEIKFTRVTIHHKK